MKTRIGLFARHVRLRANSAAGGGGDRVWVRGAIFHGDNERHSNQTYIRYSDLDGDANQAGADADEVEYTNEARLSITGSVVADGVKKTKIQISAFSQNIAPSQTAPMTRTRTSPLWGRISTPIPDYRCQRGVSPRRSGRTFMTGAAGCGSANKSGDPNAFPVVPPAIYFTGDLAQYSDLRWTFRGARDFQF